MPITKPAGFFGRNYWCKLCDARYDHEPHKCTESCPMCKNNQCKNTAKEKWATVYTCKLCKTNFAMHQCLEAHEKNEACKGKRHCEKCKKLISAKKFSTDDTHPDCGLRYCLTCKKLVDPENHPFCFIQPYVPKKGTPDYEKEEEEGEVEEDDDDDEEDILDLLGGHEEDYDEELLAAKEKAEVDAAEKAEKDKTVLYYFDTETELNERKIHKVCLVNMQKENGEESEFYGDIDDIDIDRFRLTR